MSELPRPSATDYGRLFRVSTPEGERELDIYSDEGYQASLAAVDTQQLAATACPTR